MPSVTGLIEQLRCAPPRCGRTRVALIDGPAGSGKTTLAGRLGEALGSQVLHADDMYEGWTGLGTLDAVLLDQVLRPLATGGTATFHRWDWISSARAEPIEVPSDDALVIEGVGVASRAARAFASLVIYVEAPWNTRLERGLARDGEAMRAQWERWQQIEWPVLTREGTRAAADHVLDGTQRIPD